VNTFITANIPASLVATAVKITDALGSGHPGMFRAAMTAADGEIESVGFISSGYIRDTSPILAGRTAMTEALGDTDVTAQEISNFMDALDLTGDEPRQRIEKLKAEATATISAIDWVQPTGAESAIEKGAFRKHNGKTWVSLQDANVFEPGVASWRVTWGSATDTPPDWVQPTGAQDAYRTGERVTHNGSTWHTLNDFNVFEPGTLNAGWVEEGVTPGNEWATGVAYSVGDEVDYEGTTYRCLQAHTSIAGWQPPNVPALWEVV